MSGAAAKVLVALLEKLVTAEFFSKVLIYSLEAWAKQTETDWDDKVVNAGKKALGVE